MTDLMTPTPERLFPQIGRPDAPAIVDVCIEQDFQDDPFLIPGSFRWPFDRVLDLTANLEARDVVVVCQKGHKLSQGAAALLRSSGIRATALAAGMSGWGASGLPRVPAELALTRIWALDDRTTQSGIATAWVITRLLTPTATVLWVPGAELDGVCERFGARRAPGPSDILAGISPQWPALAGFFELADGPAASPVLKGCEALHDTPEARFDAMSALCDMLFAAATSDVAGRT